METVYGIADERDLVATWREELGAYEGQDIKFAIDMMRHEFKEFPPTLFQFADLCRDAMRSRIKSTGRVEFSQSTAEPINPEMLVEIRKLLDASRKRDPKDWARRVLARNEAGGPDRPPMIAVTSAKEALGIA